MVTRRSARDSVAVNDIAVGSKPADVVAIIKIYHDQVLVDFLSFLLFTATTILPIFARSNPLSTS